MAPKYPLVEWGGGCNLCGHEPWNEGDDHDPGCEGGQYQAEIVRLRAENEHLRAENTNLRASLRLMVEDHPFVMDGDNGAMVASWFVHEAKTALDG